MQKPIRIGINATVLKNPVTGVAKRLLELILPIAKYHPHYHFFFFTKDTISLNTVHPSLTALPNVSLIRSHCPNEFFWNHFLLPRLLKRYQILLFDSQWGGGLPLLPFPKPCIYFTTIHDIIPLQYSHTPRKKYSLLPLKTLFHKFWFKQKLSATLNKADYIFTVSKTTKLDLLATLPLTQKNKLRIERKIKVLPNGIHFPTSLEKKPSPFKKPYFYYIGGFNSRKNVETLLIAFNALLNKNHLYPKSIFLLLSGSVNTYCQKNLLPLHGKLTHKKNIIFLHYTEEKNLPLYYSNAIALVYPSLLEGFAMPPVEAAVYNCPSLTHPLPALQEIPLSSRKIINMKNSAILEKEMSLLLKNLPLKKESRGQIRQDLKNYQWKILSENYRHYYKKALSLLSP